MPNIHFSFPSWEAAVLFGLNWCGHPNVLMMDLWPSAESYPLPLMSQGWEVISSSCSPSHKFSSLFGQDGMQMSPGILLPFSCHERSQCVKTFICQKEQSQRKTQGLAARRPHCHWALLFRKPMIPYVLPKLIIFWYSANKACDIIKYLFFQLKYCQIEKVGLSCWPVSDLTI